MDRAGDPDVIVEMGTPGHGASHFCNLTAVVALDVLTDGIDGPDLTGRKRW
jgi:hypothetical protein